MKLIRCILASVFLTFPILTACQKTEPLSVTKTSEHIEIYDLTLASLLELNAKWDILAEGYEWSEGPTWDKARGQLYFTDVPRNKAYVWKDGEGAQIFLDPSSSSVTAGFREPGANSLLYVDKDKVLLANHGERAVQSLNLNDKSRKILAENYKGKKFNSPNDLVMARNGDIYFSDPPYDLEGLNNSPLKEMPFNGVYKLSAGGDISLVTDRLTFPNGLVLSPDNRFFISHNQILICRQFL